MSKYIVLMIFFSIFGSCNNDNPGDVIISSEEINVNGTKYSESKNGFEMTYASLIEALNANEAITIIAEVDHAANARSVGRILNPTKIVFFGNPALGTPLMQKNQLAGLDLPQKILVFQNSANTVYAFYNSIPYLESRYGLQDVSTLSTSSMALENLVTNATSSSIKRATELAVPEGEGIITVVSNQNFQDTYSTLKSAIFSNENLNIVTELDHQANAASVDLELRPTKLIIFGNPNLGSPLMQDLQVIALDLPQKTLVWEDENGIVKISYNDPFYLQQRYNLQGNQEVLDQISEALSGLAKVAAGL